MPSVKVKDEGLRESEKMRSFQHHYSKSCNENGLLPYGNKTKNGDLLEKVRALKTEKLPRQTAKDRLETRRNSGMLPAWTFQKPWPSRKLTGVDEPVKNMSHVPHYLQRTDNGDNIHDKALNFGVLEWGLLEKWTYNQESVTDGGIGNTVSNLANPSTFATFGFTRQSYATMSSSLSAGKKSLSVNPQKRHSVIGSLNNKCEKENSGQIIGFRPSRVSLTKFPNQINNHPDPNFIKNDNRTSSKVTNSEVMSLESSLARYTIEGAIAARAVDQNFSWTGAKISEDYSDSHIVKDTPRSSQEGRVRWDSGYFDLDSPFTTSAKRTEGNCNNFSGNLAEDSDITHDYTHVPHSCPLPCTTIDDEPETSSALPPENAVQNGKSICVNDEQLSLKIPCKQLEVGTRKDSKRSGAKATDAAGQKSSDRPSYAGLKRMNISSSLKENTSEGQFDSVFCPHNRHGVQAMRNNKGRQSPLRRLLDPLLKPINNLVLPGRHSCELSGICKSSDGLYKSSIRSIDPTCQSRRSMDTSNQLSENGKTVQQGESHRETGAPLSRALLQLAWKNGLPLFMLSSNDNEVLAATITMRPVSSNDDMEYGIFTLKDSKKKTLFSRNNGNKIKKPLLISNVVGQLRASLDRMRSCDDGSFHVVREFVLLGDELAPTFPKPVDSLTRNELAAIVVKIPLHRPKSLNIGMQCRSKCRGSSPTNSEEKTSAPKEENDLKSNQLDYVADLPGAIVILPSAVHGFSNDGEPTSLIERWRSGGACDCGGWDEGCKLTILRESFQDCNTFVSPQDFIRAPDTCRFKLFIQGAPEDKFHAISMVPLREGQYAVDFLPSMSLLQAFAICIAILHDKRPNNHSVESKSLQEQIVNTHLGRDPGRTHGNITSYVPNHPPLSPVGRA